jgi:hypothetical protein
MKWKFKISAKKGGDKTSKLIFLVWSPALFVIITKKQDVLRHFTAAKHPVFLFFARP